MSNNFEVWKNHFINQARGLIPHQEKFYSVTVDKGGGAEVGKNNESINLVSPMQQVVERAKTDISNPTNIYDPVTGIIRHSSTRPRTVRKSSKGISSKRKKRSRAKKKHKYLHKKSSKKSTKSKAKVKGRKRK